MHFEIHVEDQSGKRMLDILLPRIVDEKDTFVVHPYKGIGRIPKNMKDPKDAEHRILLENLPKILRGHGRTFRGYGEDYRAVVIVVCDLDDKCLMTFRDELHGLLALCDPEPPARFCIAIEEGEAWLLGDHAAIKAAYPGVKDAMLAAYEYDSICGTWEKLADAIHPGDAETLSSLGWQGIGAEKFRWAEAITPHMNVDENRSPSFAYFRETLRKLSAAN
jgi:hypothetical protein